MVSFLICCLMTALSNNNLADSFIISGNRRNRLSSTRNVHNDLAFTLHATAHSLSGISDEILAIVQKRNMSGGATDGLKARPGYTFGLGCDEWEASSYSGNIEGWNSEPLILWASRSLLTELPYETKPIFEDEPVSDLKMQPPSDIVRAVQTRIDLHFSVGSSVDVPHMRMSISETKDGYAVFLDYVPRVELLNSMEYFDKYFQNVEGSISALLAVGVSAGLVTLKPSPSALSRMLQSPFAVSVNVRLQGGDIVKDLCLDYATRWVSWLNTATAELEVEKQLAANNAEMSIEAEVDPLGESEEARKAKEEEVKEKQLKQEKLVSMYGRDQRIQKLFFEEQKYELAIVMGASFAPKAAELAAAIVGPSIGQSSYTLY